MQRALTKKPLSRMQEVTCVLVGIGLTNAEIAGHLGVSVDMVQQHIKRAVAKIPGDLPARARCAAWARGASLDVLQGLTLRFEMAARNKNAVSVPPSTREVVQSNGTT